ncbi:MAG: type III-B CRISPR module-associated Cmr3 family protein [Candidatus Xenobia bacterium]
MKTLVLEPRDGLIARDGRAFSADTSARASTRPFPLPSLTAGGFRTRSGRRADGVFDPNRIPDLLNKNVHGPLLVSLKDDGSIDEWYFPAPADALIFNDESNGKLDCRHLTPHRIGESAASDLDSLRLLAPRVRDRHKPTPQLPYSGVGVRSVSG